ncbi:uncharacterized protein FIBRA_06774 [Fibroporia radiculosa]|uniref:Snf7-domain-containing protein n=1 Tax=Fibroporia radiculosa TaxID=599839 RepID=J4GCG8_9APHY|nr:uncharacterized protein FIBRA_06774 [Fibroporia radiculosa]CCM04593.1 predicted protein [Fibroporia radiculosa]
MSTSQLTSLPTYSSTSTSRLKYLYSDFSLQKHSNPLSYSSNIEWWRRTLEDVIRKGSLSHRMGQSPARSERLILHASGAALSEDFRLEGVGKPLSLPTIITELCEHKAFFPLSEFLSASTSVYDPGWLPFRIASYVVGKPLWWALQQLNIVSNEEDALGHAGYGDQWKKVKGDYVVLSLVEQAADAIIQRQRDKTTGSLADPLYSLDSFRREFANQAFDDVMLSDLDVEVLIKFLERDRKVLVIQKEVMKFVETGGAQSRDITPVDEGLLEIKTALTKLQAQIDGLQKQIDRRSQQVSVALRQKRKEVALSHLRTKKQLEDLLSKRVNSLDTLQFTLHRVEASAGDVEIIKSYESSTATLRAILAHPSLQRERIDDTMDALASANADAKEIDDVIRMGVVMTQAEAGIDDSDLEEELKRLVAAAEQENAEKVKVERQRLEDEGHKAIQERLVSKALRAPSDTMNKGEVLTDDEIEPISEPLAQ